MALAIGDLDLGRNSDDDFQDGNLHHPVRTLHKNRDTNDICPTKRAKSSVVADGAKKTACPVCAAVFSRISNLRRHVRTLHKSVEADDIIRPMSN